MRQTPIIWLLGVFAILGLLTVGILAWSRPAPVVPTEPAVAKYPRQETIGFSVENRAIEAYTYSVGSSTSSTNSGQVKLLFVGGIHGGYEWNSVVLAYELMDYLKTNPDLLPAGVAVTVIPSPNPDGVFAVVGKEGRFAATEVPVGVDQVPGRFNANQVDLNRNFDCKWQAESLWRGRPVSAGTAAFSEPEARALRDFVLKNKPQAVVFWHSQANAVYASECEAGILPETRKIMTAYAEAAGYQAVDTFDAYAVTGDAEGWLAALDVPAITVELATHETIEWEKNLAGVKALLQLFAPGGEAD